MYLCWGAFSEGHQKPSSPIFLLHHNMQDQERYLLFLQQCTMGSNIPSLQATCTIGGALAIPPMPAFGAETWGQGALVGTLTPDPDYFPLWM
eukprot:7563298-Ditylum_brightwellii.AAC.1